MGRASLAALFVCLMMGVGLAQEKPERIGRVTVLTPKSGIGLELLQGYREHLGWHKSAGDRWTWHGWFISSGERTGRILDAAFDLGWQDLDRPVDPAGDIADFNRTVSPLLQHAEVTLWRERPDLGGATFPDAPASFMVLTTVVLRPDAESTFVPRVRKLRCASCTWFEVHGGEQPTFVLTQQCRNSSEAGSALEAAKGLLSGDVVSARSELLRYRTDLLYRPEPKRQ